ncbi:hypothetical protein FRB93_013493 [Tulasnella sp. JGI-2019a]|nr:hypothetical protein FRB93_013493 [Tulasnella sp. JGI-2019a]
MFSSSLATFTFPSGPFTGPMKDQSTGRTLYQVNTKTPLLGSSTTTITRYHGSRIAVLHWKSILKPMAVVTLQGTTVPVKQVLCGAMFSSKKIWVDDFGNEFYWKHGVCRNALHQLVARFDRPVHHSIRKNEPATLSVDRAYLPQLDMILLTAIIIEHARQQNHKRISASAASAGTLSGS